MANVMRIGGGSGQPNVLTVAVDSGAVVTATNGDKTVVATSVGGNAVLKLPKAGIWSLYAELDGQTTEDVIEISDDYPVEVAFGLPLSSLAEGSLVKLNENGSGVNFYLAKHDYESGLNGTGRELVVRKDCYDKRLWASNNVNAYATSTIDSWLNNDYKSLLDSSIQEMIGTTTFYYTPGNGNKTVTTLARSVFLLSLTEYGLTGSWYNTEGSALSTASIIRLAYLNGSAVTHYTRSPSTYNTTNVYWVYSDGASNNSGYATDQYGSRPVFTLPYDAMVNPTPNSDGSYTLIV